MYLDFDGIWYIMALKRYTLFGISSDVVYGFNLMVNLVLKVGPNTTPSYPPAPSKGALMVFEIPFGV